MYSNFNIWKSSLLVYIRLFEIFGEHNYTSQLLGGFWAINIDRYYWSFDRRCRFQPRFDRLEWKSREYDINGWTSQQMDSIYRRPVSISNIDFTTDFIGFSQDLTDWVGVTRVWCLWFVEKSISIDIVDLSTGVIGCSPDLIDQDGNCASMIGMDGRAGRMNRSDAGINQCYQFLTGVVFYA